ncbi:Sugar transporter ERD6-like 5 [Glycine max]|nr:Sugar transporter ERD6-like 5 [Glycine max]
MKLQVNYSTFGSIVTVGAMTGSIVSGKIADYAGRRVDYTEALQHQTEALQHQTEASIIGLFQSQYLKTLTVGVGLMILQQFGGVSGFLFYTNSIFISAGFWDSLGTIATVAVKVPLTTLGVLLMDKCGRRPLLLDLHKWNGISPIMALVDYACPPSNKNHLTVSSLNPSSKQQTQYLKSARHMTCLQHYRPHLSYLYNTSQYSL